MLFIFGAGQIGEVCNYYFSKNDLYRQRAFVVDAEFYSESSIDNTPVLSFDEAIKLTDKSNDFWFTAMSYKSRNMSRQNKYNFLKKLGLKFASFVHPTANLWEGFKIPENSLILENNIFQYKSTLGSNSIIWSNNHVGHHTNVGENSFISSGVIISGNCQIEDNCFFGVNSTVFDGIQIKSKAIISGGAIVNRNILTSEVFKGNLL